MNPCITNDTPLVPGARRAPVGISNGVIGRGVHREVRDESSRELVGGNDRVRAGDEVAERDQFARRVEPGLEVVEAARPILVVGHVVFSRPEQLHGHARQPGLRPLLGDDSRDLADLDVVVAVQTTAESAARPHQVHRDLVGLDAGAERRILEARNLAARPDFQLAVGGVVRRRILRLERRVGEERKHVLRLDDLGRALERRFGVADRRRCRGRRGPAAETPAPTAAWPAPRSRRCFASPPALRPR